MSLCVTYESCSWMTASEEAMGAIRQIEDRFNKRLKYPYVIFTEKEVSEVVAAKMSWLYDGRVSFGEPTIFHFFLPLSISGGWI